MWLYKKQKHKLQLQKLQVHVEPMPVQLGFIPFGGADFKKHVILHFYISPCPCPPPFPQAADSYSGLLSPSLYCSVQWLLPFWKSYS